MGKARDKIQIPKVTITLILLGGLLALLSGVLAILGTPTGFAFMDGHLMIQPLQGISIYHGVIEAMSGAVLMVSAVHINSQNAARAQNWAIIALVFSVISLIGGGGFFIGFVLALIGSTVGMAYGYAAFGRYAYARPIAVNVSRKRQAPQEIPQKSILASLKTEEKKLYDLTEEAGGAIFQADLVDKSGFSKVKVSRLLDRLEGRGLIERKRRGMTNMVVIKKEANPPYHAF